MTRRCASVALLLCNAPSFEKVGFHLHVQFNLPTQRMDIGTKLCENIGIRRAIFPYHSFGLNF